MSFRIVPESLSNSINAKMDAATSHLPVTKADRLIMYRQLIAYFDEHGELPDFTIESLPEPASNRQNT